MTNHGKDELIQGIQNWFKFQKSVHIIDHFNRIIEKIIGLSLNR